MKMKVFCKRLVTVVVSAAMVLTTVPMDTYAAQVNDETVAVAESISEEDLLNTEICSSTDNKGSVDELLSEDVVADSEEKQEEILGEEEIPEEILESAEEEELPDKALENDNSEEVVSEEQLGELATKRITQLNLVNKTETGNSLEGWSYDDATNTLYLDSVDFDVANDYAIIIDEDLNIEVKGECSIAGGLGGIKCVGNNTIINIGVQEGETGSLTITQKSDAGISGSNVAAGIFANATGVNLNIQAPTTFVSNGINSYTTYNIENITVSSDIDVTARNDAFFNSANKSNGTLTVSSGAKANVCAAGYMVCMKELKLDFSGELYLTEWAVENQITTNPGVLVEDFSTLNGGKLNTWYLKRTVLQVENSFDVKNSNVFNVHAFTFGAQYDTPAIRYDGETPLKIYDGGIVEAASNNGDGLYIKRADLDITNGGTYTMLSPTNSNSDYYGLHMVKGDINLGTGGTIKSADYSKDVHYAYGCGILMDAHDYEEENYYLADPEDGDINVGLGGSISLRTYYCPIDLEGKGSFVVDGANVTISSYYSCLYVSYSDMKKERIKVTNGASMSAECLGYYSILSGDNINMLVDGGATFEGLTPSSDATCFSSLVIKGENTKCNFSNSGAYEVVEVNNLKVSDKAVFNCDGRIEVDELLEVSDNAELNVNVSIWNNYDEALYLLNCEANIFSGGKVRLMPMEDKECYGYMLGLYNSGINIYGDESLLFLQTTENQTTPIKGYGTSTEIIEINEGTLQAECANGFISKYDSYPFKGNIYVKNGADLKINSLLTEGGIISGDAKIAIDNSNLLISKPDVNTDATISDDCKLSVNRATVAEPEEGYVTEGILRKKNNEIVTGDVKIESNNDYGIYILKQPANTIRGEVGAGLTADVQVKVINGNEDEVRYQWYLSEKVLGTDTYKETTVTGATAAKLVIPDEIGIREYYCEITLGDLKLESNRCSVTLLPDEDSERKARTETLVIDNDTRSKTNAQEGWTWDKDSRRLVLDNVIFDVNSSSAVLIKTSPVTIEVKGKCLISNDSEKAFDFDVPYNPSGNSQIVFEGDGTLFIRSRSHGINYYNVDVISHVPLDIETENGVIIYGYYNNSSFSSDKPISGISGTNWGINVSGNIDISADTFIQSNSSNMIYSGGKGSFKDCSIKLKGKNTQGLSCSAGVELDNVKMDIQTDSQAVYSSAKLSIKNGSEVKINQNGTSGYVIYVKDFELIDSKLDISGKASYGIYSDYASEDIVIKNSDLTMNFHGDEYGIYGGKGINAEDSNIDIKGVAVAANLYGNGNSLILKGTEFSTEAKGTSWGTAAIYVGGDVQLCDNSRVLVDYSASNYYALYCNGKLTVFESTMKVSKPDSETYSVVYCNGFDDIGTNIITPQGAYYDDNRHIISATGDACPNELEIVLDPNPYVITDKIVVKENNKLVDESAPHVSQNSNTTMTVEYRMPKGKPAGMEISWYRYNFIEKKYEIVSGANSKTVSIATEKIGGTRYKVEIKYGNKVRFIECDVDVVPPNREITLADENKSEKYFYDGKYEDRMSTHGWLWDGDKGELILNNAYFATGFRVPRGTRIIMVEGSENYIRHDNFGISNCYTDMKKDKVGIYGSASLMIDAGYGGYSGGGIGGFNQVDVGPDVNLTINLLQQSGTAISTPNGTGKLCANCANVEILADGEFTVSVWGSIETEGCDIIVPSKYYNDGYNLYSDEGFTQKVKRIKIEQTKQPYLVQTLEPNTVLFMNKGSISPVDANVKAFNFGSTDDLTIEWFKVSDWYKANPNKVSDGKTLVPENEIGEQLYYYKASVMNGEYSIESDVFAVCVMPEGRQPIFEKGLSLAYANDTSDEDYEKYGYRWDKANKVLTLDNVFLYASDRFLLGALSVPYGTTIRVTEGSTNVIRVDGTTPLAVNDGSGTRSLTFSGDGSLILENVNKNYTNNIFLFQDLNGGLTFNDNVNVTIRGSRSKGYYTVQVYDGFTVDNATVNIESGEGQAAISCFSGTTNNTKGMVLRNNAKLNVNCFGWAYYSNRQNILSVDETSELNIVCKELPGHEGDKGYGNGMGYYTNGTITIDGKVSIETASTDVTTSGGEIISTGNLTIGKTGELICTCKANDCVNPVLGVDGVINLNGKMKVSTASPSNAIRVNMGTFNVNAGSQLTLENNSSLSRDLASATLAVVVGKMCVYGDVEIYNLGGGPAVVLNENERYNLGGLTRGNNVSFIPNVDYIKYSYRPQYTTLYRFILSETLSEGETVSDNERKEVSTLRMVGGEKPVELESVEITGTAKSGETLSVATVTPENATAGYEWQYSDTADGTFSPVYYSTDAFKLDKSYIGKYIRLKVTGRGKYIGTIYSNVLGPVAGNGTDIKSVTIDSDDYRFGSANYLYKTVEYTTDSVQIGVEPYESDSHVTINGNSGKTYTFENLSYGYNYVTIVVSDGVDSVTYTIRIQRNNPPKYTLKFGADPVLPEGISVAITKNDGTGSITIPSSSSAELLNIYKDEKYTISYDGDNDLYGIWAVKSNGITSSFGNYKSFIVKAGKDETVTLDADCYYVKAPLNLKAEWNPSGRDSVTVSWDLPDNAYPTALSEAYDFNLVKVECIDPENPDEPIIMTQKSTSDRSVMFTGLSADKNYDFVAYYANDTGKKYVPSYLPESFVALTRATTSVGTCPGGYELKVYDFGTENEVQYKAVKGYTDGEEPESVKLSTNLPNGISLGVEELSCENPDLLNVSLDEGVIILTPMKDMTGSTYITLTPSIYGNKSATQIRVDVFSEEPSEPKVTKTTLTTNVYYENATDEATERIFFETADKVTDVTWADESLNTYFVCEIKDDRSFVVLPNPEFDFASTENAAEVKKIKGSYKSELIVKSVKNPEGKKTVPVTLKVTKKLPTVKAAAVKLNTFTEDVSAPIDITVSQGSITGVEIDESKTTAKAKACPDWISFDENDCSITVPGQGGKYSGKLCLKVYVEGYNAPVALAVSVSASKTAPKVKLSTTKLTLPKHKGDMARPVAMSILSTDKKVSFDSLNFTDVEVANAGDIEVLPEKTKQQYMASLSYKVKDFDSETGEFTIIPTDRSEALLSGKVLIYAYVGGKTSQRVEFTVTVANTDKVTIKPSVKTLNLDLSAGTASGEFEIVPSASGYNMGTFSKVGYEEDTLKIDIKDAKGKESCNNALTVNYNPTAGIVTVKSNEDTLPGSYKLFITDKDGATCNLVVKTNAALPKYKANVSTITLNKNISNDVAELSISADKYAKTDCTIAVCDSKGKEITENIPLTITEKQTGSNWNIKLNEYAGYGMSYKLMVIYKLSDYAVSAKPMSITVKVPAENAKTDVKLKVSGAIDPARINSTIVVKPTYSNVTAVAVWNNVSEQMKPELIVTAMNGKSVAGGGDNDYIGEGGDVSDWFDYYYDSETGEIVIFENADSDAYEKDAFDATLTYNAKFSMPGVTVLKDGAEAVYETAVFKLPIKQNKINILLSNNGKSSLCQADKDDRNYVVFKIDDASVSKIKSAKIFTKNGAVSNFTLEEVKTGSGLYRLGFTNAEVSPKINAETLTINFRFEGCKDESKATSVKIKIDLQKAN